MTDVELRLWHDAETRYKELEKLNRVDFLLRMEDE